MTAAITAIDWEDLTRRAFEVRSAPTRLTRTTTLERR